MASGPNVAGPVPCLQHQPALIHLPNAPALSLLLLSLCYLFSHPAHSPSPSPLPPSSESLSLSLASSILFPTLSPFSDFIHSPGLSSADTPGESFLKSPEPQGGGALHGEACPPCPQHRQQEAHTLYWNCHLPCGSCQSGVLCRCTCEAFQMLRLSTAPPAVFVWTAEASCMNVVRGWDFQGRSW